MAFKKTILFISINGHQKRYFHALQAALSSRYEVNHVHYALSHAISTFLPITPIPKKLNILPEDINNILNYMKLKNKYRGMTSIQRLFQRENALYRQAIAAIHYFYNYITSKHIDLVCVWNGSLIPLAAATIIAKKLGKKTLYFENGYLPGTTVVDPKGVNNHNSLVGLSKSFYETVEIDEAKLEKIRKERPVARTIKRKWYDRLKLSNQSPEHDAVSLPEHYILIPLQVHDDTQILLHSPNIKSMDQLVDCVTTAVEQYNICSDIPISIVVKAHPSDSGRIDYSKIEQTCRKKKALFLRYYPTQTLIKQAAGIITINSTVGIEALIQHKPVITLGNAFYNVPGIVHHVDDPKMLPDMIPVIANQQVNHRLIDQFLYYLGIHI